MANREADAFCRMGPETVMFRAKPELVEATRQEEWGVPPRRMDGGETGTGSPGLPGLVLQVSAGFTAGRPRGAPS